MWYKKYIICCLLISYFSYSQDKSPIQYISEPVATIFVDMANINLSSSTKYSNTLYSLAFPGLGSSLVSERDRGKKTKITAAALAMISIASKVISNNAYNTYKEMGIDDYQSNRIEQKYNQANIANYVFLGSVSAYFSLGISDFFQSRQYVKNTTINRFD